MAQRVYWVGLYQLVKRLCDYWARYSNRVPSDLPGSVATAMAALTIACAALKAYDDAHTHGKPTTT